MTLTSYLPMILMLFYVWLIEKNKIKDITLLEIMNVHDEPKPTTEPKIHRFIVHTEYLVSDGSHDQFIDTRNIIHICQYKIPQQLNKFPIPSQPPLRNNQVMKCNIPHLQGCSVN